MNPRFVGLVLAFVLPGWLLPLSLAGADSPLVFNEIMYHPQTNEAALEWVELQNQLNVDLDISRWSISGGIEFTFPEGTIVPAGRHLVLAASPPALAALTGTSNIFGPFVDRLSNAGETLRLRNNNGRILDEVAYGVEGDWPVAPDGAGPSLARLRPNIATKEPQHWRASAERGGTPGRENFPVIPPAVSTNDVLLINNSWRFNDTGLDPGPAWREPAFNDSNWPLGSSTFFHTDAVLPAPKNTPLAPGRISYYFRTTFQYSGEALRTELNLRPLIDDGAIGYLNGVEIFRLNMPAGPVNYSTLALGPVADATFQEPLSLSADNLQPGANVLAVEIHQAPLFANYPAIIASALPIAYWRLGENSTPGLDSSAVAGVQHGTFSGLASTNFGQAGPRPSDRVNTLPLAGFEESNLAPRFSGNNDGGNDAFTIPDSGVFNFAGSRVFSIEAWVNGPPSQEDGGAIIAKGTGGGGEQFAIDVVGGNFRFFGWDGGSPNTPFVCQANVGPNNSWQHLVAVLDQPAGRMKVYVNGLERGSATPRATLLSNTHEVSIGARKNNGSLGYDLNFDGRIDEVALYNRALTTNEIVAHFNAALVSNNASGPDTNDAVFGLTLTTAETQLPPPPVQLAFNELASSTNNAFWLELINPGKVPANLQQCVIARLGGTNRQYLLPARTLAPGELVAISKEELGFGVDSGDRLILYGPGGTNVFDAVVAKKDPRGRSPDGIGSWWFPAHATPGASNAFTFRDELVINEILYHPREFPGEAATYSATNTAILLTNQWRYQADGSDLGTAWREPAFPDTAWPLAPAMFYAPISGVSLPAPKNTFLPLTNELGARVLTYYFRTRFTFNGDTNHLQAAFRSVIDDGAVFYLNGVEVLRVGMPATNVTYNTLATVNVGLPPISGPTPFPVAALVQGENTLAVEVHQASTNNNDFNFATELQFWNELTPARPFRESPEAWVEILNRSTHPVNLTGWRLDEGIDYRFPSNQVMAPGGFLVVAKDVEFVRALHPSINVLGPFTNRLSKATDYIVLKDPGNNPASEVRYYDDGRWPDRADGGGSSLELVDPRAETKSPEAWAASDESQRAPWQTYTWRGIAQPGQTGEPTLWREFALGLLDGAGEVLIDDVSILETPATTPRQLLANGHFDLGSSAHWRFVGNHRHSRIRPDPDEPSNYVLHLVSSGAAEYQGNQIEVTLTNNAAIIDGREYEISFRARWLAGHRKLNSRLYFNRLARTFDLAVPARTGTPGAPNSRRVANLGPTFEGLVHSPVIPKPYRSVRVGVRATDPDGIASASLHYSVAGGPWQAVAMSPDPEATPTLSPGIALAGTIPGQAAAAVVQFYVAATDLGGATSTFPSAGTNSRALYIVQDGQATPGQRQLRVIMTPADATFLHTPTNTLSNELLGGTVVSDERDVYYDIGVRLKGSFVGRNVARVGFHLSFPPEQPFRGAHQVLSIDRAMHTAIGNVGEILIKHIAGHAGGIPNVYDDITRFIAPLPSYSSVAGLRMSAFDNDWLDAQFQNGSDGGLYEVEVLRWNLATVNGNPEAPKAVGNESGGTGYANLEVQDYGGDPERYRWMFLPVNNRTVDDFTVVTNVARTFSLTGASFEASARRWLDVDQWLRTMAYQQLVGTADAYFTGANIHNFRLYARPEDQRMLYVPWDWDSAFLAAPTAPIYGSGNITKLLGIPTFRRMFLHHLSDLISRTFNTGYMARWTGHYGAVSGQDFTAYLNYIQQRAAYVTGQLPNANFAVTNNAGNDFTVTNGSVLLAGTAPLGVRTIEINGVAYPLAWLNDTTWRLALPLPLYAGINSLVIQGVDSRGTRPAILADLITVSNAGPAALFPVVINEWMADNAGPGGYRDPADGLFQDWLELYNPNPVAIDLTGYFLTDDPVSPEKWALPAGSQIGPGSFLVVWADEDGLQNYPGNGLHANFRLSAGGEFLALSSPAGVRQHAFFFGPQTNGLSQGLYPDGSTNGVRFMADWTPGAPNRITALPAPALGPVNVGFDGTISLSHPAIPGRVYELQFSASLNPPVWISGPQIRAASPALDFQDDPSGQPQRFYRVVLLP
jgi:hypothetical protein